ncbi:MAG: hypothetical protein LBH43_11675 [Treponema sp.]|nr:hypothetical protein [Treponema sp.]
MEKSVCPHGGAVILSGDKPQPASYSITNPLPQAVCRSYTERPSVAGRAANLWFA